MSAQIIDGKVLADKILQEVAEKVERLKKKNIYPCLAVFYVGDDPATASYIRGKEKDCERCGIISKTFHFDESVDALEFYYAVQKVARDASFHGILIQMPLPPHVRSEIVLQPVPAYKDVDGLTKVNRAYLYSNEPAYFYPCTPRGCMTMIKSTGIELDGANAVVIGRSNIVGKPMAQMLLNKNCTVTMCHSHTKNLASICRNADILVAAVGKPKLITADMIKPGAVVIDVGINRVNGRLCGDVDFGNVKEVAGYITPVPGGVGLMTRAMLMNNVALAAEKSQIVGD